MNRKEDQKRNRAIWVRVLQAKNADRPKLNSPLIDLFIMTFGSALIEQVWLITKII